MIKNILLIGLGGGLGSIARYATSQYADKYLSSVLPYGTFIANILGSLLIGVLLGYLVDHPSQNFKLLLVTGFCGGFTTFSTFTYENFSYLQNGQIGLFLLYTLGSVVIGLLTVFAGFNLVKLF
ncbi:camphor resistance protein CrcB [Marivirga sericea]|uniref:Fluoride-specific ion channel FluC n=1 Tax=Marivirga sericea TaxID=1028 RepID=A0A1X7KGS7_9BACT|nr:fluoride efflux transporter CrcB [Marivirga sericea]SMG40122.1 camphor resistance protein CrcB [Marivirga sericea]